MQTFSLPFCVMAFCVYRYDTRQIDNLYIRIVPFIQYAQCSRIRKILLPVSLPALPWRGARRRKIGKLSLFEYPVGVLVIRTRDPILPLFVPRPVLRHAGRGESDIRHAFSPVHRPLPSSSFPSSRQAQPTRRQFKERGHWRRSIAFSLFMPYNHLYMRIRHGAASFGIVRPIRHT